MAASYKKLWKLLIDKDLKKKDLAKIANISNYTVTKLTRGDNVTTDVLGRICEALDCSIEDIMEFIPDPEKKQLKSVIWDTLECKIIMHQYKKSRPLQ